MSLLVSQMEREQSIDMDWAVSVMSGRGLTTDSKESAIGMLENIRTYGCNEAIRKTADRIINHYSAVEALAEAA